jgi:hypothetical protein
MISPDASVTSPAARWLARLSGGICYAITLKRASRGWKIASLVILLLIGTIGNLANLGRRNLAIRADAQAALANLVRAADAGPDAPPIDPGPDAGPFTRMGAKSANMLIADARAFHTAQTAAGLATVISFHGLTKSSAVLDHCERLDAVATQADALADRYPAYVAAARAEGEAMIARGRLDQPGMEKFLTGLTAEQAEFHRQWTIAAGIARTGTALCRILARRRWEMGDDGRVLFAYGGDLEAARALLAKLQPDLDAISATSRANAVRSAEKLRAR